MTIVKIVVDKTLYVEPYNFFVKKLKKIERGIDVTTKRRTIVLPARFIGKCAYVVFVKDEPRKSNKT